jgi:hypothetical protein
MHRIAALAFALALAGCIYTDVRTPLQYNSPTPGDVGNNLGQEVQGRACNYVFLYLLAIGDGGYDAAVRDARAKSGAQLIADVKADTSILNVLSVYQRQCTVVSGRVATIASAAPAPSASAK